MLITQKQKIKELARWISISNMPDPWSDEPGRRMETIFDYISNDRGEYGLDVEINRLRREIHSDNLKISCNCDGDLV